MENDKFRSGDYTTKFMEEHKLYNDLIFLNKLSLS